MSSLGVRQTSRPARPARAKPETVLVIGAGGPVGRSIAAAIGAHPALTAIAGLRRRPMAAAAPDIRLADATDARALAACLDGCTLAVNAVGGSPDTLRAATRAICEAARRSGLRRLVHISSMAVYGGAATGLVTEASPCARAPTAYEAAKIDCEATVRAFVADGHDAVILRPGIVFGPASAQWAARPARLLRAGRLGDLGGAGDGFCNLTHEPDLGAAIIAALLTSAAAGRTINLASADPPTWNAFLSQFGRALGATPVPRITSRRLAFESRLLAPVLQAAKIATRSQLPPGTLPDPIPPSLLRLFSQRMRADPSLADRLLAIPRTQDAAAILTTAIALALA